MQVSTNNGEQMLSYSNSNGAYSIRKVISFTWAKSIIHILGSTF